MNERATAARRSVALVSMLVMLLAAATSAGDDRAAELFRAAQAAYESRDYPAAARAFEQAHQLDPRGATALSAAMSWEAAAELGAAADDYAMALASGDLSDVDAIYARERLAVLDPKLGRIVVREPPRAKVSVAHAVDRQVPVEIRLLPGQHQVEVRSAAGARHAETVRVERGKTHELLPFRPRPAPRPSAQPTSRQPTSPQPMSSEPTSSERARPEGSRAGEAMDARVAWGIGMFAAAAVFGGAAIGLGVAALDANDEFEASFRSDADARDRAVTLRAVTNVAWGVSGAALVTGTVLLLVGVSAGDDDVARAATCSCVRF